ncbi:hypothetical protein T05_9738 [Trichinella murrelli]|uniref:Uncharacterized protein n=1 Tax=Trichinella murrelli TaxID=144512 RepID=A0A0V0SWL3_9BILA|nr:hypothetical protein T05_9738 [Trichinella murrelli]
MAAPVGVRETPSRLTDEHAKWPLRDQRRPKAWQPTDVNGDLDCRRK